jgi:hypothetical protein
MSRVPSVLAIPFETVRLTNGFLATRSRCCCDVLLLTKYVIDM